MSNFDKLLKKIKDDKIEFVDVRFTDTHGKWQHMEFESSSLTSKNYEEGIAFDGSSIQGWRPINRSDMLLKPDPNKVVVDPFTAHSTLVVFCDVHDDEHNPYDKDPRSVAKFAEEYLKSTGIGDAAYFGPEPEFFMFDDIRFSSGPYGSFYQVDSSELPSNNSTKYEEGNTGHRPGVKGGYFPVAPVDGAHDIRAEMVKAMNEMGLKANKHHHEVAPAQHELGYDFSTLTETADNTQIYKYCVSMVAHSFGKSATFMPKPIFGDNGSGMHVHQSIWKNGKNVFAGDKHCGLSQVALWYIGGIMKHAHALNAITNPTTNSYKRLIPGFEAPTMLVYSQQNRSAACRIPISHSRNGIRIETRFPDAMANPYLCFTALMMAGIDGIKNKIDPGDPINVDLYALSRKEAKKIPTMAQDLRGALNALDKDREFLKQGDVMSDNMIDSYINLKINEQRDVESYPHPEEFSLYYSR